jgi:hypothetical protein
MLQLQEEKNWNKPAATTWAAEFLLREGESRECLGSWINSSAVHEAKKRRAKQVIASWFPCGKWLHMIGARASPGCELCKRERGMGMASTDALPIETVAHIQSAGCKAQKKSVIGDHNRCWKYLIGAISTHGETKRSLEFIGGDKGRQLKQLWAETRIGDILPWDEIEDEAAWLLESARDNRRAPDGNHAGKEQEDDHRPLQWSRKMTTDPYNPNLQLKMKQTPTMKSFLDEGDLTQWLLTGLVKLCTS